MPYKKAMLLLILIFSFNFCVFAQKIAFAYGVEINNYSVEGLAGGALLGFDINLPGRYAAGFNITGSGGKNGNSAVEASGFFRYYFSEDHTRFFVQGDLGAVIINEPRGVSKINDADHLFTVLAGVRGGYRFPLGNFFYAEPYIRAGYPFLIGGGIIMGYRF